MMKNIKHLFAALLLLPAMHACEVSYNDAFIDPSADYGTARDIDPKFKDSGLTDVSQIAIYESYEYTAVYQRTYGISREVKMNLSVDAEALDSYNTLFDEQYKLLPPEYYVMPGDVAFGKKQSATDFAVTFYPEKLVEKVGLNEASQYILPIRGIPDTDKGVVADSALNVTLLHIAMSEPIVTVQIPPTHEQLDFVKDSGFDEHVVIAAQLNFTGFDRSLLSVGGSQDDVDAYNAANGTDYKLLPADNYLFDEMTVDAQDRLTINGKINANGLDDSFAYLLPCRLSSPVYTGIQSAPVYFVVNITELFVSVANGGKVVPNYSNKLKTLTDYLTVNLNSIVGMDINTHFVYDPSLVTPYNTEHGTAYHTLDAERVTIDEAFIPGGTKTVSIPYVLNVEGLSVEEHYLLPFVLQTGDILFGSVTGSPIVYVDYAKSLLGDYTLEVLATSRTRNVQNVVWPASQCTRGADPLWATAMSNAQYGLGADGDYYSILFKVTDRDVAGKPGCKQIEIFTFLEAIADYGGNNKVTDNQSYYDSTTGRIFIDFDGYESWNQLEGRETYSLSLPQ
jgi:hypothetical protein